MSSVVGPDGPSVVSGSQLVSRDRPAASSSRIAFTTSAGSDNGRWSDWHRVRGAWITGSTMRRHHPGRAPATSRAMEAGSTVEPSCSATIALSVVADSTSATTRGIMPARMKCSSTSLRTML